MNPITVGGTSPRMDGLWAHRPKKDFPSNRPQEISEVDERYAVENVTPIQVVLNQLDPVEVPIRAELQIYE